MIPKEWEKITVYNFDYENKSIHVKASAYGDIFEIQATSTDDDLKSFSGDIYCAGCTPPRANMTFMGVQNPFYFEFYKPPKDLYDKFE